MREYVDCVAHRQEDGAVVLEWPEGRGNVLMTPELLEEMVGRINACVTDHAAGDASTPTVPDSIKMLRETFCVAQAAINATVPDIDRRAEHVDRLQRLIDDCDRQRPLGPDGKHDDRHTPTCGCDRA